MSSKESPSNREINTQKETILEDILTLIDKITKNAEEKIILEDSIKNIIKGSDLFVDHIKLIDQEKRKELLDFYNKILDGLKQKVTTL
ncbi:MAG: hypothetical protein M3Z01_00255 [Thermoproteota archaeon]|nr:hypothetical protein [Thermoproteota archaeon]